MRVLQVNKFLYRRGGAEAVMEDTAALLQEAGHETGFFGMDHPLNVHNELQATFPPCVDLDPPPNGLVARLSAAQRMVWSPVAARGIRQALERFRPDVVHFHNVYHQLSPSVVHAVAAAGVPSVMTLHDYKLACPTYQFLDHGQPCQACLGGRFGQAARRRCKDDSLTASSLLAFESTVHARLRLYAGVRRFLCPSDFMLDTMTRAGVFPDRLVHLPNFAMPSATPPKSEPGGPVLFAGRLSDEKGLDVLIRAMGLVPSSSLVVAGEGPARDGLVGLAELHAPGRVEFLGRLTRDEVHERMVAASVVCVPSRWYENQPVTILEAMSLGLPVIATSMGGMTELVVPGMTGWLVPADDPRALAAAMAEALGDPGSTLTRGARARERYELMHSPQRHLESLVAVYEEVTTTSTRRTT